MRMANYPPEELIFTRKSGVRYLHIGREVGSYPEFRTTDYIKSLSTGKIKKMPESELIIFKNG